MDNNSDEEQGRNISISCGGYGIVKKRAKILFKLTFVPPTIAGASVSRNQDVCQKCIVSDDS